MTSSTSQPTRLWRPSSLLLIGTFWAILYLFFGLFSPGLLDDVDSVYTEIAREMLARHDFVTPTVDGIRFFDKPPLMYWMAAASMHLFGQHDWAARLPLALGVLALLLAVYALGIRLFAAISPPNAPDRAGLYAALATGISIGPYLYTRFYIPDILIALWMTLAVHLLLLALDRIDQHRSTLLPSLAFAGVLALNLLTKGLIGLVFPLGFVLVYLLIVEKPRRLKDILKLHPALSTAVFLAIAAPWHILAALRNPPIPMPPGLGLPARAGWTWFYLYNEHIARFLQKRIPHDYGQVPIPLFWALLFLWLIPWTAFVFPALLNAIRALRSSSIFPQMPVTSTEAPPQESVISTEAHRAQWRDLRSAPAQDRSAEAARALLLWAALILGFFTLSSRQEYYHLPALPALALFAAGLLAAADAVTNLTSETATKAGWPILSQSERVGSAPAQSELTNLSKVEETTPANHSQREAPTTANAKRQALTASRYFLVPLGTLLSVLCGYFALTAPKPAPGATLSDLLSSNPNLYTLSLGHVFDLTGRAMGLFRGPLTAVALAMLLLGPGTHLLRRRGQTYAANLLLAAAMTVVLLAAHEGLVRFYPILGSKQLAQAIEAQRQPGDLVAIDGELTSGSTLLFYGQTPVYLINGRINGPWFGSFWPDAPHLFWTDTDLATQWAGPHRVFLFTYHPDQRTPELARLAPVHTLASAGGKTVLTNR